MDMQILRRGTPPPSPWGDDIPYYWDGEEFVETTGGWVIGASEGIGSQSKEIDHLFLSLFDNPSSAARRTYVSDIKIDLTNINNLKIEWENYDTHPDGGIGIFVSEIKEDDSKISQLSISGNFSKMISTLDVSSITGFYYVKITVRDGSSIDDCFVNHKTYKVWGEK